MKIDKSIMADMDSRYRATFINSLAGVKQAVLIGTKSVEGECNLAIFNSLIHIGANPPLWGFLFRPATVRRDTLTNILHTKCYTLNYVSIADYEKAHQTSAKFEREVSEFESCGFTERYLHDFQAPFVAEAPVQVAMHLEQRVDIPINNTILIIGSLQFVELDERIVSEDGFVALDHARTVASAGLDAYYETRLLGRLPYARPGQQQQGQ